MNTTEAARLARNLMNQHGVGHLGFEFDRARVRFGGAHRRGPTFFKITLSEALTKANDEATVRGVILHEIAHVKAGANAGHGPRFKQIAREIGGFATCSIQATAPPPRYSGACGCRVHHKDRLPRGNPLFTCRKCQISFRFQRGVVSAPKVAIAAASVKAPPATLEEWRRQKALDQRG